MMRRFKPVKNKPLTAIYAVIVVGFAVGCFVFVWHDSRSPRSSVVKANRVAAVGSAPKLVPVGGSGVPSAAGKLSPASPAPSTTTKTTTWPASPQPTSITSNSLVLTASSPQARPGETITISLYENSDDSEVNAVQARITYDPAGLELANIDTVGDFTQQAATDTQTPGVIQIARATGGTAGLSGSQAVVNLHFRLKATATGRQSVAADLARSYLVRAADSVNILQTTTAANLIVQGW